MSNPSIKEPSTQKAPSLHIYDGDGFSIAYQMIGRDDQPIVIWGHGWGQSHAAFMPLAESLQALARHIIIDFPGFGESPLPFDRIEDSWGSREYADAIAQFIQDNFAGQRIFWIGHSFGCRVATQLGAHYPELITAMVYIAGAGLKRKRSFLERLYIRGKIITYKLGKRFKNLPFLKLMVGHGSADYHNAGALRGTLVKVVNEDLVDEAKHVNCPVLLIYGSNDTETPPETGERYKTLIKNAEIVHLAGQDHYTVLSEGRHSVAGLIKNFVGRHLS